MRRIPTSWAIAAAVISLASGQAVFTDLGPLPEGHPANDTVAFHRFHKFHKVYQFVVPHGVAWHRGIYSYSATYGLTFRCKMHMIRRVSASQSVSQLSGFYF